MILIIYHALEYVAISILFLINGEWWMVALYSYIQMAANDQCIIS